MMENTITWPTCSRSNKTTILDAVSRVEIASVRRKSSMLKLAHAVVKTAKETGLNLTILFLLNFFAINKQTNSSLLIDSKNAFECATYLEKKKDLKLGLF